jgi:hypothetical protein
MRVSKYGCTKSIRVSHAVLTGTLTLDEESGELDFIPDHIGLVEP